MSNDSTIREIEVALRQLNQADREFARRVESGQAAARCDHEQRAGDATLLQRLVEAAEIAVHHRLHVGVGDRGRPALVLADLGRDLARQRDRDAGQQVGQDVASTSLMLAVEIGVHVADGDRLDAGGLQPGCERAYRALVQRDQHVATAVHALGNAEAQVARHQRRWLDHEDVVLLEAVLEGDLDRIAKTLGHDQCRLGALALDDGIGCERRAVNDQAEITRLGAGELHDLGHAGQHAFFRRARRGQHLGAGALAVPFEAEVGEGATDVDCQPCLFHCAIPLYAAVC
jgi:hypothetical protein